MKHSASDSTNLKSWTFLHLSIVLFSFTAILGKLIQLPGLHIVWYRLLITCISLFAFPGLVAKMRKVPRKDWVKIGGIGIVVIVHWVGFYEAIKYSNASITVSCLATMALFTAFLEPLYFKRPIKLSEVIVGLVVIGGFLLMFGFVGDQFGLGMIIALVSAFLGALFVILNKSIVNKYDVFAITQIQFITGWLFISLIAPLYLQVFPGESMYPSRTDWLYLIVLALLCTTLAYSLHLLALRDVSAFSVNLAFNLEPIYAILMAFVLLREDKEMDSRFYIGAAIIFLAIMGNSLWMRFRKRLNSPRSTIQGPQPKQAP